MSKQRNSLRNHNFGSLSFRLPFKAFIRKVIPMINFGKIFPLSSSKVIILKNCSSQFPAHARLNRILFKQKGIPEPLISLLYFSKRTYIGKKVYWFLTFV